MPRQPSSPIDLDDAEGLALQALTFLLSDAQRLSRFMSLTGIGPGDIRTAAATSDLQAATLEYMLSDESLLLMFCQEAGVNPMIIAPARDILAKQDS
jgi:hypothetical protein